MRTSTKKNEPAALVAAPANPSKFTLEQIQETFGGKGRIITQHVREGRVVFERVVTAGNIPGVGWVAFTVILNPAEPDGIQVFCPRFEYQEIALEHVRV